jgi:hypothetical protein
VTLYYIVALVVVDGYLTQAPGPALAARYDASARELLQLVVGRWADSLQLWPKLFIHTSLIAALSLPADDALVRRTYELLANRGTILQTSGGKLIHRLAEHVQRTMGPELVAQQDPLPVISPIGDVDIPIAMAYTASDSFWADLSGMLGLDGEIQVAQQYMGWGQEGGDLPE